MKRPTTDMAKTAGERSAGEGSMKCRGFRCHVLSLVLLVLLPLLVSSNAGAVGGDIVWQRGDTKAGKQQATASIVDSQGNVIVAGYQNLTGNTNDDYYTVKFKADGSGILWSATYDMTSNSDKINDVIVDSNDDVIITGAMWNGVSLDIHTIKYCGATGSPSCGGRNGGEIIWEHSYNGTANGNDAGTAIASDSSNNIYVGGYSQNSSGREDFLLLKYSAAGGPPLWEARYSGPPGYPGTNKIASVAVGASGVAVTGQSWNGSVFECATIKYDLNGNSLWPQVKRYTDGPYPCFGKIVRMDNAGDVYIAASASNGLDLDIYTAKYAAGNGALLWAATFDGRDSDEPKGMVVTSNGYLYVTGYSSTPNGHYDFYTSQQDSATGSTFWRNIYDSGDGNADIVAESDAIALDPSGDSVYVTGYALAAGISSIETLKYKAATGNVIWNQLYNFSAGKSNRPVGLGLAPNGDVVIGAWADTAATNVDYIALRYDKGALNPPTGLTLQTMSSTSIKLTWTSNSDNEGGFRIERCTLFNCSDFGEITTVGPGIVSYTDNGLTKDTYYSYRVRAYNAGGNSQYTNIAQAVTTSVPAVPPAWSYTYNGLADSDDYAGAIAVGPDNNPVITGATHDYFPGYTSGGLTWDYLTFKLDRSSNSSPVWTERFDGPSSASDVATCVAVDNANIATVSGYATLNVDGTDINSLYTIRYKALAANPQALSADQYNGPGATDDRAVAIATAVDSSNNVAVVGYGKNAAGNDDIYLLKYNSSGALLWDAVPFDNGGDDMPLAVAFAPDGSIYVTGFSEKLPRTNPKNYNFYTARYSGINGSRIWTDVYSPASSTDNTASGIAVDTNGDVYVTGYSTGASGNSDFYTIKYKGGNAAALKLWEKASVNTGTHGDQAKAVGIDPIDGNIVVAGTSKSLAGDKDFRVLRYSVAGDLLWDRIYQKPGSDETANAMVINSNGNIYVTGPTYNGSTKNSITVSFNYLQGDVAGATIYTGAANKSDETDSIAINSFDEVFAAGYTTKADNSTDALVYKILPVAPTVPSPLSVTTPTITTATLSWPSRPSDKDGYNVQRQLGACSSSNSNPWGTAVPLAASATTFTDNSLVPGSTYCYRVQSFRNSDSTASRWKEVSVTLPTSTAPSGVTSTLVNTTQINLRWSDNTLGETGFRMERCGLATCTETDFAQTGAIQPANAISYSDVDACPGITYKYRVIAVGTAWETAPSDIFIAPTTTSPSTPVLTVTRASEVQVNLTWTDINNDQSGYNVERSPDGINYSIIASGLAGSARSYNDTSAVPGAENYYRVTAYKTATCGWTRTSLPKSAVTTILEPNNFTATANSTTQITLGWGDRTASETGFKILRCQGSGCTPTAPPIHTTLAGAISYVDTSVSEDTTYNYQILATSSTASWDAASAVVERKTPAAATPTLTSATRFSETRIDLAWTDASNTDETGYKVYRCTGTGCTPTVQLGSNLAANTFSYNDTTVVPGTTYVYKVSVFKTASNGWEKASSQSGDTTASILEPNNVTAIANSTTQITVGWGDRTASETGFKILRCQGSGCSPTDPPIYTTLANVISYVDTSVAENTTYNYQVVATSSTASWNAASAVVGRTTPAAATPTLTSATRFSEARIDLAWTDASNTDETGYKVYRCTGAGCTPTIQLGSNLAANTFSYSDTAVVPDTTYVYRVSAFKTATSGWEKTTLPSGDTTATILEPNNVTATANNTTQITLGWGDRTATETGFQIWRCANPPCTTTMLTTTTANASGYTDNSACHGTTYAYEVRSVNSTLPWYSLFATPASSVTTGSPSAPSTFTVTQLSENSVKLDWNDPNSDESGYSVERCNGDSSYCAADETRYTVTYPLAAGTTTYTNSGLTPNSTYTYRVRVYKTATCGWSLVSASQSVSTTVPAPSSLTLQALSSTSMKLTWSNTTTTETGFVVERCSGSGCNDFSVVGASSSIAAHATTFTDSSVCAGISYTYRIKSKNASLGWESSYSDLSNLSLPQPAASFPNLLSDPNFEDATSGWSAAPVGGSIAGAVIDGSVYYNGVKSLKITGDAAANMGRSQAITVAAGQQYVLSGYVKSSLTSGSATCNVYGAGITSDPGFSIAANDPRNNTWVNLGESVTIPAGTTSVNVQCFTVSGSVGTVNIDGLSFTKVFVVTPSTVNESKISLSWPDVSTDETGYNVLKCIGASCSQIAQVGAGVLTYTDTGLTPPGSSYNYQVQAYKTATCGWVFPASSIVTGTTAANPAAPTGLTAIANNTTQITVSWTNNTSAETGIVVERCQQGSTCPTYTAITTTAPGISSYIDTSVAQGTTYQYQVKAINTVVPWESGYSVSVTRATPAAAPPVLSDPTPVSDTRIDLSWTDPNSDETSYLVLRDDVVIATKPAGTTSYSDTGVVAGNSYTYMIRATKTAANSWTADSNTKTVSPSTPAPSSLSVTVASSTQLNLSWTNGTTTETEVRIERCKDAGSACSNFGQIDSITTKPDTSYNDTSVIPGKTYRYRVRAANTGTPGWTTGYSNIASNTPTALGVPGAPTATRASEAQINLSWSAVANASGYNVYYCTGTGCTPSTLATPTGVTATTYQHTGLAANTVYRYLLTTYKTGTTGCPDTTTCQSGQGTASANTTTTLDGPTALTGTPQNSTSVLLSWQDNTVSETGFSIERCTGVNCSSNPANFSVINTTTSPAAPNSTGAASWTDTTAAAVTTYQYRLRAANAGWTAATTPGYSGYSNIITVTTPNAGPPGPVTSVNSTNKVVLTWGDNCSGATQETGFNILRCTGSGCSPVSTIYSRGANTTSSATYADSTVCSGTDYVYQVNATGASCTFSSSTLAATTATPATPVLNSVTRTSEVTLSLSWTDSTPDAASYDIYRCNGSSCSDFAKIGSKSGTPLTYDDNSVLPDTTYTYLVKGLGATVSGCTAWTTTSNSMSQVSNVYVPASLTASVVNMNRIDLSWTDTNATTSGWKIERCTGSSCTNFVEIGSLSTKTPASYSDTTVSAGQTYQYRVRATGSTTFSGNVYYWASGYSSVSSATTALPVAPTSLAATMVSASQINLTWTASSTADLDGYSIERCQGQGCLDFVQITTVTPYTASSYQNTSLNSSTTYRYRIRGYKTVGGTYTGYSNIAEAVTLMTAPGSLTATAVGSHAIRLSWNEIFPGQDSLIVMVQIWNGEWVQLATLDGSVGDYTDISGVTPLSTYTYMVRAFRGNVYADSNTASVTIPGYSASDSSVCVDSLPNQPQISSTPVTSATEGVLYSYNVTATAVGTGNSIASYSLGVKPNGMNINASTGAITWTPDYTQSGNMNVTVRVKDAFGVTAIQSFVIAVANDIQLPRINSTAVTTCNGVACTVGQNYSYQVQASDPEGNSLTFGLTTAPAGMDISASGLITWTAQAGANNVTVSVSNGSKTKTQSFSIPVTAYHPLAITSSPSLSAVNGAPYSYQLAVTNTDNYPLSYTLTTAPGGMTISPSGNITWVPVSSQTGDQQVIVQVSDGSLAVPVTQAFTITVSQYNVPTISSSPGGSPQAQEGTQYSYQVTATAPFGGPYTYSLITAPAGMSISGTGLVTWTPVTGQGGAAVPVTVKVQAGSISANSTTQSFTIAVPFMSSTPGATPRATVGTAYSYTAVVNKLWASGTPAYSMISNPAGMTINSSTGAINWTPAANQTGNSTLNVKATIGSVYATQTFSIAVPSISSTAPTTAAVGSAYATTVTAVDPAGGAFTYSLINTGATPPPAGMTINSASGAITWTPAAGQGANSVPVTVKAVVNGTTPAIYATQTFNLSVVSITSTPTSTASVGVPYSYSVVATGTSLVYSLDSAPAGMTIDSSTGVVSWPNPPAGSYSATVRVTTGGASYVTQTFSGTAYVSPAAPTGLAASPNSIDTGCGGSVAVALSWNSVTGPGGHAVEYSVVISGVAQAWQSGTTYNYNATGTQNVYVKARDAVTKAESPLSVAATITDAQTCNSGSCPMLYTWDGAKFAFEVDVFGTGKLGLKSGNGYVKPNPNDFYLLRNQPAAGEDGLFELRMVEERSESDFMDAVKLYSVDLPEGRDVYTEQTPFDITNVEQPATVLHTVSSSLKQPVSIVHLNTGRNVSGLLAASDGNYLVLNDDKNNLAWQTLEIDFGDISQAPMLKLILNANSVYPTSPAGFSQANALSPSPDRTKLEVLDENGNWVVIPRSQVILSKPKEFSSPYIVNLTNIFLTNIYKIRLSFVFKTYVDSILFDTTADEPISINEIPFVSASLGYYGSSSRTNLGEVYGFLYGVPGDTVYSQMPGNYTRYGDVTPLLTNTDDKYAIYKGGDEVRLKFGKAVPPPAGTVRRYLLYSHGYYKDFKSNSVIPKTVEPMPFDAMSNFPYDPAVENYPDDDDHNLYRQNYNTRVVAP